MLDDQKQDDEQTKSEARGSIKLPLEFIDRDSSQPASKDK